MAFSAPMDGPSLSFTTAEPTSELLRLKPLMRFSLLCLFLNAVLMLIVDYFPAAVVDLLTVMYGYMMLRRDMQGLVQGLPAFTLIAGLDCALQIFTLMQLLTVAPGAQYFLSDTCPLNVTQVKDGHTIHKHIDPCSWHTITGNLALVASVVLEFVCMRLSLKMFKSVREAANNSLLSLLDVEGGDAGGRFQDPLAFAAASGPSAEGPRGDPRLAALLDRRADRPAQGAAQGPGFTPYQGQAHKLAD